MDDYIQQKSIKKLDLLKIDVEGYGGYVLRCAKQTIARLKPVILMEFHAGSDEYMVFNELVSPDYTVTTIEGHPITDVTGGAVPAHGKVIQAD